MKAAVVSAFDSGPRYEEFPDPATPDAPGMLVEVVAAGLHPRVRSQADGSHYTSTGELPFVPGIDGVGRGADGALRYFILPDTTLGSMAERTVIDARRSIVLPQDADPIAVAAAMNPAMSSWIALRQRVQFERGQGALEHDALVGFAVLQPHLAPGMANFAVLHVTRSHRRTGVGARLAEEVIRLARLQGASTLYVSATPSAPTVKFYMALGFQPTAQPHAELFRDEPDDIHMTLEL